MQSRMFSTEHFDLKTGTPWPGTTNGWQNEDEIDVMEYDQTAKTSYGGTSHSWYGILLRLA